MGGGPGTAALAAAVCKAGGLGSIAAAYLLPEQIVAAVREVRALTSRPFSVNLFAGGSSTTVDRDPARILQLLGPVHLRLGLPAPALPAVMPDPFPEQLEAVLEARPAVFSFTFGIPDRSALSRIRARGIAILGTATTVEEGRMLAAAGVDAVIAQGSEAGAHRGTFASPFEQATVFEQAMTPTAELVRGLAPFCSVIASGGIMDGHDVRAMLSAGASAVQMGTAFLTCPESGASEPYKQALLAARGDTTVITRAFSGRPARGLRNVFIDMLAGSEEAILPFPIQNSLTRPMREAAARQGKADYLSLWAGQGVSRCRVLPAGLLVQSLLD